MSAFYSDYSGKESKFEGRSSVRNFLWDLSPAGGWGKGVVEQLLVRVDVRALLRDSMPIRLQGLPFLLEDSVYVATVHRFALKSAQPLQFSWNPHPTQYRRLFHSSLMENPKWRASTGVAAYPVSNLDDRNLSTAWVAPAGSGEVWLETDLPRGFGPTAVAVCAGYAKSTTTLVGNARPQEITMTWTPAEITYVGGGTVDTAKLGFEDRDHIRELLAPKTTDLGDGCYLDAPPKALEEMNPAILQFWEGTYWRSGGKIRFDFKRPKPGRNPRTWPYRKSFFSTDAFRSGNVGEVLPARLPAVDDRSRLQFRRLRRLPPVSRQGRSAPRPRSPLLHRNRPLVPTSPHPPHLRQFSSAPLPPRNPSNTHPGSSGRERPSVRPPIPRA
ncbi:MAG: hypothetical protein IPK50_00170 [Fibrobacterota bacterium]|nr:MAG: hypothetical protein IPK50_00170 [Fibrobacterota bacterium]